MSKQKINQRIREKLISKGYFYHYGGKFNLKDSINHQSGVYIKKGNLSFYCGKSWKAAEKHYNKKNK